MPFISASAISPYNNIKGGAVKILGTLLLDLYPGASAAYSLRQLRTAYEGPAIKVRRSSDDELQDIGFIDGNLDTTSLLSFVGSGDGFVKTWYDQSGAGIMGNGVQISESDQPKIAENGFVTLYNSMPVIKFSNSLISFENLINDSNERTIFALFNYSGASEQSVFNNSSVSGYRIQASLNRQGANTVGLRSFAGGINTTTGNNLTQEQNLMSVIRPDLSTLNSYANNVLAEFNYTSRGGSGINDIGRLGTSFPLNGGFSEYIIYQSEQSANIRGVETNINNYYSVYPRALDFNPYNIWDSEHISINNTTTTLTDFNTVGTAYDLVNPAASNQPTYTSADSSFRELPSLTFDGSGEYVSNAVSDYRGGDSSGMYISVFKYIGGNTFNFLTSSDEDTPARYISQSRLENGATRYDNIYRGNISNINTTQSEIISGDIEIQALAGNGSSYITYNSNGVIDNTVSGNVSYQWFSEVGQRDNVVIGASVTNSIDYSNISWCMSGYFPYVDDETTLSLITALKNKYIDATVVVDPILAFNPYNVWSSENVIIDGTETTFLDFNNSSDGASYNLVNPAATNQPSYNPSDSDFNNLPSFTFDGVDEYVKNSVSLYRYGDSSGMYISVFKYLGGVYFQFLTSTDENNNGRFIKQSLTGGTVQYTHRWGGGTSNIDTTQSNINAGDIEIQGLAGNGSSYITYNSDGVIANTVSGNSSYKWFNGVPSRNNIAIGASIEPTLLAANITWCMTGYFPYVDDETTLDLISLLKTKYGIN